MYNILTKENFHEALMHLKMSNSLYVTFGDESLRDIVEKIIGAMNNLYPESKTRMILTSNGIFVAWFSGCSLPLGPDERDLVQFILNRYSTLSIGDYD